MALPHAREARSFYQAAMQRFSDAQFLLDNKRTTGAVYLAGYSVECMLKALLLSVLSPGERADMVKSFLGSKGHNFAWLKRRYLENGGPPVPATVERRLMVAATWRTDMRYLSSALRESEARLFLAACEGILSWVDGRL
jgi:HEPN domain-containing protein